MSKMTMNDMIMISVDDHLVEPPDMFLGRMPEKYKNQAPRVAQFANGDERWVIGGKTFAGIGPAAVSGRKREDLGDEPTRYAEVRRGTFDIDARIEDMNANGTFMSLNFSSVPGFAADKLMGGSDMDLMLAILRAHNDWHIEEWVGSYPDRMIGNAILPLWDIDLALAELRRVYEKGFRVVCFPENPVTSFKQPSIHWGHWDRLFAEIVERDMTVAVHIGTAGGFLPTPSLESPADVGVTLLNIKIADAMSDFLFSPLLRKFPTLRILMSEGCMGWVPFLRERADAAYRNHRYWTHANLGDLLPSDILKRHFMYCFHEDNFGLSVRHQIGIDQISWECDYPHADSTWPSSPEQLWASVKDFPKEEIDKITHLNATRFIKLDPFKRVKPEDATVGALRAQARHIDLTPLAGGMKPVKTREVLSAGDVVQMFQQGNAALGEPVGYL